MDSQGITCPEMISKYFYCCFWNVEMWCLKPFLDLKNLSQWLQVMDTPSKWFALMYCNVSHNVSLLSFFSTHLAHFGLYIYPSHLKPSFGLCPSLIGQLLQISKEVCACWQGWSIISNWLKLCAFLCWYSFALLGKLVLVPSSWTNFFL